MLCRIISDDGWYISAPTYWEARSLAIDHLVAYVGDISILEAEALLSHDVERGIVCIIHPTRGTHRYVH